MASHLAEAAADYERQGLSSEEARLAALRSFGGIAQVRQVHREARSFMWLDDLRQDIRYTRRTMVRNPVFALVVVLTLALGIGANTAIFTLLDAVVFRPLPVPAAAELLMLYENGPDGTADPTGGTGRYLRFSYPRFERLQQALGSSGSLAGGDPECQVCRTAAGCRPSLISSARSSCPAATSRPCGCQPPAGGFSQPLTSMRLRRSRS